MRIRHKHQLNFVPLTSLCLSPEDFRDAFCVARGAFGRPWVDNPAKTRLDETRISSCLRNSNESTV